LQAEGTVEIPEINPPPGVIFINILGAAFLYESVLCSFSPITTLCFVIFWHYNISAKDSFKMSVKFDTGGDKQKVKVVTSFNVPIGANANQTTTTTTTTTSTTTSTTQPTNTTERELKVRGKYNFDL
jgi:hypothetical protein